MRNLCAPTKVVVVTPPKPLEEARMGATATTPCLELRGVTVTFGGLVALDDVSLAAQPHQVLGVIGPNGAGKTTLFNVACGFVTPDTGRIVRRGDDVTGLRPHSSPDWDGHLDSGRPGAGPVERPRSWRIGDEDGRRTGAERAIRCPCPRQTRGHRRTRAAKRGTTGSQWRGRGGTGGTSSVPGG